MTTADDIRQRFDRICNAYDYFDRNPQLNSEVEAAWAAADAAGVDVADLAHDWQVTSERRFIALTASARPGQSDDRIGTYTRLRDAKQAIEERVALACLARVTWHKPYCDVWEARL